MTESVCVDTTVARAPTGGLEIGQWTVGAKTHLALKSFVSFSVG